MSWKLLLGLAAVVLTTGLIAFGEINLLTSFLQNLGGVR